MTKTGSTGLSRRRVLKGGAALVAGAVAMPAYLRAQGAAIKIGILPQEQIRERIMAIAKGE